LRGCAKKPKINFACLAQIDYLDMNEDEKTAVLNFYEIVGPDEFYQREWKKVNLTFLDGSVLENVFVYDTCCYKQASNSIEESMQACVNPIG